MEPVYLRPTVFCSLTVIGWRTPKSGVRTTSAELDKYCSVWQTLKVLHSSESAVLYSFLFFLVTIAKTLVELS